MEIQKAVTKEDFIKCWHVFQELRPCLDQDRYLTLTLYMIDEHYRLIYVEIDGKAISVCGYRVVTILQHGRSIYIDELYTLSEARGKGYATALLKNVIQFAKSEEINCIHLSLEYKSSDAHKFYLNHKFKLAGHTLTREL